MDAVDTVPPARTALVTGASRGIGREIALGLARAGLDVALLARDGQRLAEVAEEIRGLGRAAVVLTADVTAEAEVRDAVARAEAPAADGGLGSLDLLVNNAGRIEAETPLWESDPDDWWATFEVNVRGVYLVSRYVVPGMLARGAGRVVDLASGASTHGRPVISAYVGSKTAILRMGEHLHLAGYDRGLRSFEVAPGVVATDMTASMPMHQERTEWTPVARTVDLVNAIAAGTLDACSGWHVRATDDTPESLRALAASAGNGPVPAAARRRLRVLPAGPEDPLGDLFTGR
ncbi:SDR family NAD(P)-dependent oxidoreductase [Myceligenerans sp. TRM 65318]|uniref:SDR family NAD(P)-dependent oxidoreductase n=1 Tax=Myceligenerans pegani TaxID=2776917 RepID=A0ABR9MYN5_9MICO|nr:SDR family NAD(P)-dependent oxidoreductase [Myceligenerans sp. TRM 65318]MBE3018764.1 SDR family NAD(P)-dependent oxidoreductase [Myceligenerans sp. TRM 65318]